MFFSFPYYFYCTISFPFLFQLHSHSDGKTTDAVQNDKGDEKKQQEELEKQMKALSTTDTSETTPSAPPTAPPNKPAGNTPEGSPSKSPSKKKKKFKAPCFLKKSKKQKEKTEAWTFSKCSSLILTNTSSHPLCIRLLIFTCHTSFWLWFCDLKHVFGTLCPRRCKFHNASLMHTEYDPSPCFKMNCT